MMHEKHGKIRDSRFELLRIISIFMIVISHFSIFSQNYRIHLDANNLDLIGAKLFSGYGQIGVDIFVLITGYFLGKRKSSFSSSIDRFWKIWSETFFYTILSFLIFNVVSGKFVGFKALLVSFFPFTLSTYRFVTAYIMLIFLIPFVNKLLSLLKKKEFIILIIILIIFNDILPIVHNYNSSYVYGLGVILTAYIIGVYISRFEINIQHKCTWSILCLLFMYLVMYSGSILLGPTRGNRINTGVFPLIEAVLIFLITIDAKPFKSIFINNLATTAFSGYLVTEYPLTRTVLWKALSFSDISNSFLADFMGVISIMILLYVLIFTVDILRQKIFSYLNINKFPRFIFKEINSIKKYFSI